MIAEIALELRPTPPIRGRDTVKNVRVARCIGSGFAASPKPTSPGQNEGQSRGRSDHACVYRTRSRVKDKGCLFRSPWLARALSYCTVKLTMTLCVIDPEIALTVTCIVAGDAGVVACCGVADEEQPVIAVATTSRRAKSDPPARIDLRFRPANASSPTGPRNARVRSVRDWNKWTG